MNSGPPALLKRRKLEALNALYPEGHNLKVVNEKGINELPFYKTGALNQAELWDLKFNEKRMYLKIVFRIQTASFKSHFS